MNYNEKQLAVNRSTQYPTQENLYVFCFYIVILYLNLAQLNNRTFHWFLNITQTFPHEIHSNTLTFYPRHDFLPHKLCIIDKSMNADVSASEGSYNVKHIVKV